MTDQKTEQQQIQRSGKSTFTPFLAETARLQELKNVYLDSLRDYDIADDTARRVIIKTARIFYAEIANRIGNESEWTRLSRIIESMKFLSINLLNDPNSLAISQFEDEAYLFINVVNQVLQASGMGLKLGDAINEIDALARALQGDTFHFNRAGIPVHWKLEQLTTFWLDRVKKELDNFWAFEGKEGFGKTTLAIQAATTFLGKQNRDFDIDTYLFSNQKKEFVYDVLRKRAKPGDVFIFDEAVNQANKKQWWKTDQVELMSLFTLMRYRGATVLFCIPDVSELDTVLRNKRLHGILSIPERGEVKVKLPNLNPAAGTYQIEKYGRNEMITTPADLSEFLSSFDKNIVTEFPFVETPKHLPIWKHYLEVKDASVTGRKMLKDFKRRAQTKPIREQMILGFLMQLDPNVATLNKKQVIIYGNAIGYSLAFESVVRYISRKTGLTPTDLIKIPNATTSTDLTADAYVDLTEPHVHTFLLNLRNIEAENNA